MANGRPTPYQAFGAMYDRIKNVTDHHGRHPYVARTLNRRDRELSLKILNLVRADGKPSAHEIDKAKRATLRVVHPDSLTGSPEFISDPAGLKICLERRGRGGDSSERIPREGDLGTHARGSVGADQERRGVPAAAEEATCGTRALPNGRGQPGAAAAAANRSTAKGGPPSDCHWRRSASPPQATTGTPAS